MKERLIAVVLMTLLASATFIAESVLETAQEIRENAGQSGPVLPFDVWKGLQGPAAIAFILMAMILIGYKLADKLIEKNHERAKAALEARAAQDKAEDERWTASLDKLSSTMEKFDTTVDRLGERLLEGDRRIEKSIDDVARMAEQNHAATMAAIHSVAAATQVAVKERVELEGKLTRGVLRGELPSEAPVLSARTGSRG